MPEPKASSEAIGDAAFSYASCEIPQPPLSSEAILAAAERILRSRALRKGRIFSVNDARQFLRINLGTREQEVFAVVHLDNRHRVLNYEELFWGTINGATVHPREVVKRALQHNAAAVVLAHNHPSGVAEPSQADRDITERLKAALALIDVRVLDHFVVGEEDTVSFAQRGLL